MKKNAAYTGALAGLFAACVVLLVVFFFVLPAVRQEAQGRTEKSGRAEKDLCLHRAFEETETFDTQDGVFFEKEAAGRNLPLPDMPKPAKKGTLVFVFDDAGHNLAQLDRFLKLPFPCTIAVLPKLPASKEAAAKIRAAGKEVILHQPMQALNVNIDPGPGAVKPGMDFEEIKKTVASNIDDLAPIAGMNNHEGSLITADAYSMQAVLEVCMEKGLFFLDSRTTVNSAASEVAESLHFPIWERSVFIDNKKTKEYMRKQIISGTEIAMQKGEVVLIGHVFTAELADLLAEMYPQLAEDGFTFSTISALKNNAE